MAGWELLKLLLDDVQEHSTLIGKVWLTVLFIFRIFILSVAGESVWTDEQSDFICNTQQPGCTNVCYDQAFPISHVRYWVLQFLFVSTPTLIYLGHMVYLSKKEEKERQKENESRILVANEAQTEVHSSATKKIRIQGPLMCTYTTSVVFKSIFEAGFLLGQWYIYGFVMSPIFVCERIPCKHKVECFVSRPMEKTIFIIFMLVVSLISLLLNLMELIHLSFKCFQHGIKEGATCSPTGIPFNGAGNRMPPQEYTNPPSSNQDIDLPSYNKMSGGHNWSRIQMEQQVNGLVKPKCQCDCWSQSAISVVVSGAPGIISNMDAVKSNHQTSSKQQYV
ncbi:hypothetical protein XELAEV_18015249mg [Xenopus laevis]|uniref:Gap junction alpha-2 protein n=2 Tax=Xenopus laevis TaxID=8355 RepID=CXA2_XENLA|nr:RecName: Full=Gap junction alpha-2 protein; AltName: Full=Connexin-38; Short=Cx38 [Xenopus laevis]OCT92193.1 hypothetical protein XELAEV_18015249mg [Xenopus laevis]CAA35107.1 unnamed protein product [Xenopus laevis]